MKINLRKILKKVATVGFSAVAVAATAGTALIPGKHSAVHAEDRNQAVVDAFNEVKGEGIYGYGTPNNWNGIAAQTGGQRKASTTDCTRTTAFIVSHFLQKMGYPGTSNPDWDVASEYSSVWGPGLQGVAAANGIKVTDLGNDWSKAQPGDVLVYDGFHVGVYGGGDTTYDAQSGKLGGTNGVHENHGSVGYAGSGPNDGPLTHVYHFELTVDVPVSASVKKSSLYPDVTNNNPNYSLAGAEFAVTATLGGKTLTGTIITDANGNGSWKDTFKGMPAGTQASSANITIKETKAPKGYKLNTKTFSGTSGFIAEVSDTDENDPAPIKITKRSDDGDVVKHPQDLQNAEFTLKFYAVDPDTADVSKLTPARTWRLKPTHKTVDPVTGADCYVGYLSEASGDALYTEGQNTAVVLPIGVLTVQETKAPDGYKTTENKYITVNNENLSVGNNGIVTMRVHSDNSLSGASVNFGHQADNKDSDVNYNVNDKNVRQGIKVTKYDYDMKNQKTQGNAPDLRAHFQIINNNTYGVAAINADGVKRAAQGQGEVVYEFDTDKDGNFTSNNNLLPTGSYIIKETKAPTGYTLLGNTQMPFSVTDDVTKDKTIIDLTGVQKENAITDKVIRGTFKVQKNDLDLGTNIVQGDNDLSGKYALINRSSNVVWVDTNGNKKIDNNEHFAPGEVINNRTDATKNDPAKKIRYTFDTEKDGTYDWGEVKDGNNVHVLPYGSYEIREVQAPKNYTTTGTTVLTFDITKDGQTENRQHGHTPGKADPQVLSNQPAYFISM